MLFCPETLIFLIILWIVIILPIEGQTMKQIDLRSDTVTEMTPEMRRCILTAEYGDHTYGEDFTVINLEMMVAEILGKESASFVPTGTFGNQCSILTAGSPGTELIVGDKAHIITYENGSVGKISRMLTRTIQCDKSMLIPVSGLKNWIRKVKDSQAPQSTVFAIQNPTSKGRIYPLDQFNQLIKIAKENGMHVHMDGARIFNACAELKIDPKQLVKQCDSVMICLSKGLCTPIGSVVAGGREFIVKFNKNRKMLGGILRKPGIVAEMGICALNTIRHEIFEDNEAARKLGKRLAEFSWIELAQKIEINMIFFKITDPRVNPMDLQNFLLERNIKALINRDQFEQTRFLTHHYIRQPQIQQICKAFADYYAKIDKKQESKQE